jgi:hypothetical protein
VGLKLSEPERHGYIDIQSGADVGELSVMNHHLLGHPFSLGRSPYLAGYLKDHDIPDPYAIDLQGTMEEQQQKVQESHDKAQELHQKLQDLQHKAEMEWRLLLQVYSNEEAAMDFAGGGVLHFCIPNEALARRDFSRVWVDLQFV